MELEETHKEREEDGERRGHGFKNLKIMAMRALALRAVQMERGKSYCGVIGTEIHIIA